MKQVFSIFAAFLILVVLLVSFGTARADPQPHFLPNESTTPTETATTDPCAVPPPKPELVAPDKGTVTDSTSMTFKWKKVVCNKRYRLVLKQGSDKGPTV